jgi:hypothetical protein
MARQEESCWRCAARWTTEEQPARTGRVAVPTVPTIAAADIADGAAATLDADRWANDGGATRIDIAPRQGARAAYAAPARTAGPARSASANGLAR